MFSPIYTQYQLSPMASEITESMGLTQGQYTSAFSAPMVPAIFLSLVAGLLVDKYGIKAMFVLAFSLSAVGSCWRIWSGSYPTLYLSMMLSGIGALFMNSSIAKIMGSWFPKHMVSRLVGISMACTSVATTLALGTTALMPSLKFAYVVAGVVSVVVVALMIVFMKDPAPEAKDAAVGKELPFTQCLRVVMRSPAVWLTALCLMLSNGCTVALNAFMPTALASRGISVAAAGAFSSAVGIGSMVGCFTSPFISAKIGKSLPFVRILSACSAVGIAFSWLAPQGPLLTVSLFLTGYCTGSMSPQLISIPIQLPEIGPVYAGTAGGVIGTLQLLGAVVIPTYIITPLSGGSHGLYYLISGALPLIILFCTIGLPELGAKVKPKIAKEAVVQH